MHMSIKDYIDLGINTVPLKGKLERHEDGSKSIPTFEKDWRTRYSSEFNEKTSAPLAGAITGEVSNIIAIDCDDAPTWNLFRSLDPHNEFVALSRGKGYDAGTLIYLYTEQLATTFSLHNDFIDLDFYSNKGFIYLPTKKNKTKYSLPSPLPQLNPCPPAIVTLLKQLTAQSLQTTTIAPATATSNSSLAPLVEQFTGKYMPSLFKIITPRDFRSLPECDGGLNPVDVPKGRGSEYLMKVSSIFGADSSINAELYVTAMNHINNMFTVPMQSSRFEDTILDPMIEGKSSIDGVQIWQYDENWKANRLILQSKRRTVIELAFDDLRNMYYVVDAMNERVRSFNRDSEMMSYIEASCVDTPKKLEVKRSLPLADVRQQPNLPFGFNGDDDNRTLNTFVQTPELLILHNPDLHKEKYKVPATTLQYLETLVPDAMMREYLLSFMKTKLTTFKYSPVILYFMGVQGSGKDVFVSLFDTILGKVARPTTREFLEMFNAWMLDTYIVQLDEYGNQLNNIRDRDEALGKIKAYTGKPQVQIRQMRTDGFQYEHSVTFIMTANKNPLMLEDGDRRIAFFETPNVLIEQDWVLDVSNVVDTIQVELRDFMYYLATEVRTLSNSDYMKPPESSGKHELIADSMYAANKLAYAIKRGMVDYILKLGESHECSTIIAAIQQKNLTTIELNELYDEMTDHEGDHRALFKILRANDIQLTPTTKMGIKGYRIKLKERDNPFA